MSTENIMIIIIVVLIVVIVVYCLMKSNVENFIAADCEKHKRVEVSLRDKKNLNSNKKNCNAQVFKNNKGKDKKCVWYQWDTNNNKTIGYCDDH